MNSEEYANLERVEAEHWYYTGKRELVGRWLARAGCLRPGLALLDCGAGTGRFGREMAEHGLDAWVLDDHEESLAMLRGRFAAERVLALGAGGIPLPDASMDVVTGLDVLEHIADDRAALKDMRRVLKPGGLVLVTVPAGMELWSDWDVKLQHHRRYTRESLRALFAGDEWEIVHENYTNVCVYPLVWMVRRWQRGRPAAKRAEDVVPWGALNWVLRRVFVATGLMRIRWPRGVSLILLARRR